MVASELSVAFAKPNPAGTLQQRYGEIEKSIRQKIGMSLTEKARATMSAVVSVYETTQVAQPDALGRIGLLERALHINEQTTRVTRSGEPSALNFINTPFVSRVAGILSKLNELTGFVDETIQLEIMDKLRTMDPLGEGLETQLAGLEARLKIDPRAVSIHTPERPASRSAQRPALKDAFAPLDKTAAMASRKTALEDRLKKIAEASDILTDESRAVMLEAVKYLESIVIDGENAEGQIGLLEDALNVHPPVYRSASTSRGDADASRSG